MTSLSLYTVSIPRSVWESFPEERVLADLAEDAREMKRRIQKGGQGVELERAMFRETVSHLQHMACAALANGYIPAHLVIEIQGYGASTWLNLVRANETILVQYGSPSLFQQPFWTAEQDASVLSGLDIFKKAFASRGLILRPQSLLSQSVTT